jgi:hypothetical protein
MSFIRTTVRGGFASLGEAVPSVITASLGVRKRL